MESFDRVVFILFCDVIYTYHRYSTCQVCLTLSSITCDNDLIQIVGCFLEYNTHTISSFNLLSLVTNIRDDKGSPRRALHMESTIKVCYRTCLGAFHHDRRADDRLSCSILNDTTNIYLLCICHCANCTERRAH